MFPSIHHQSFAKKVDTQCSNKMFHQFISLLLEIISSTTFNNTLQHTRRQTHLESTVYSNCENSNHDESNTDAYKNNHHKYEKGNRPSIPSGSPHQKKAGASPSEWYHYCIPLREERAQPNNNSIQIKSNQILIHSSPPHEACFSTHLKWQGPFGLSKHPD